MPGAAQRRYLTMLFSDLSESSRFASSLENEHYADLLARLRAIYEEVITKHGGTVVQIQGDGVLAVLGHPVAPEDSGRRATEAALDMHDAVRGLQLDEALPWLPPMSLHTGIHSGLVLFDEGDPVRGRFDLLGNATNIAKHLAEIAKSDEILVSEETLGAESHFFRTSERLSVRLGARPEPLTVYRVLARAAVTTRFEARALRGFAPFTGRRAELGILERGFHDALGGNPRHLAISAPAGQGKTRLAEEFLRRAAPRGCRIHRGYCESYFSAEPLQPFLQMLRSLFGIDHRVSPPAAAAAIDQVLAGIDPDLLAFRAEFLRVLSLNPQEGGPGEARHPFGADTIPALRNLFDRLAARTPLVIFIDDWQDSDDATRQLVGALRGLERRAVMVLTATRGFAAGDASMSDAQVLELAPFTEHEGAEIIGRLLPQVDPFVGAEIWKYAGGNPLYIEELCHVAAHEDAGRRWSKVVAGEAWLNNVIQSRVARLPEAQAELVRAAAVIGNVIPAWLLESITGRAEDDPLVRGLADQDLVFPGEPGTLRFKHGIAREVIYTAVGLYQRRDMHLRIARALRHEGSAAQHEDVYEALAYHYAGAGLAAEAAEFAELAGDKAIAASALDRAQKQYLAALAALDLLERSGANYRRWISIAQRLALACVFDPSRESLEVMRRAVTRASAKEDHAAIASAEFWLGNINYALGESRVAIEHCERALEAARRAGDQRQLLEIRTTLGQAHAAACEYERSLPLLDEAIAVKRQHRSGARPAVGLCYTLTCKGSVLGDRGQFAQAHACFDEALAALQGADHGVKGSLYCWRSAVQLWQGRWQEAQHWAMEARRVAERVKSLYLFAMGGALAAYAGWMMARDAESVRALIEATSWIESRDREQYISLNYGWLADALVTSGRLREARSRVARALARAHKHDRLGAAMACRALARASALGQARRPAEHYLGIALRVARARGSPHEIAATELCEAEIRLGRGERAEARALLDRAQSAFSAMDMRWHLAEAAALRRRL